ncbi:MFS transporter [Leuconostoc gelidum subsp. gasicomitatum]|uniref:MFS transporter n=1 Tax=Leuconostoc gasicomitatum TaxID=115778 RepID=UPI0007449071|nr:MFS transporter [Leuconostoc gasicomitatum]MBZ5953206.1 MFS transporter [Leuconostoc gasicomitatum]MBZ5988536.1 MFS transporter [Leuconostoc gasicomitatum]MBZ5990801.1 MFS transporter [Leuconostoc gasicomitatum]CUR62712.1 MFS-type transporter [Leuconostoc gasicomitatum KG16-1]
MTEIKQRTTAEYQVSYFKVRLVIYLSYIVQGFALIILAQTVQQLSTLWQSSIASTTAVVSSIGIGKLIAYPILGELSDHLDRKKLLSIAAITYILFFTLLPLTHTIFFAVIVTTLAGLANAALDAVAYPTLLEINHGKSSGNVLIKAMISLGEGLLPIILVTLINQKIWFGWLYWLATAILIVNLSTMLSIKSEKFYTLKNQTTSKVIKNKVKWQWDITKILFLIYGFSSMWLMLHFTQWVTRYFHVVQSFTTVNSHLLMTFYSIGSLVGVGLLFLITNQKWIREARLLVLTAIGTIVGLAVIVSSQEMRLASLGCFIFGISAAGGSLQLGLSQLIAHNSKFSGRLTGLYFFFGSVAFFLMPIVTGLFATKHLANMMTSLFIIAGLNLIIVVFNVFHERNR